MTVHNGAIVTLNCLSWGSNPNKTREEEHQAIMEAFKAAREKGAQPGAILLQDYEWATDTGLSILVAFINGATGSQTWKAIRQWGDEQESMRDAVVLYDRSVYIGTAIEKSSIGAFRDNEDLLAGMQPDIKAQLAEFTGRWAGVELEVVDASTGQATDLMFLLVSFHGRKIIQTKENDVLPVQTSVKAAMVKDFISQAADCAIGEEHAPVMIAGSFNIDSESLVANGGYKSGAESKASWTTTVHLSETVEKDAIGQPVAKTDYAVAVHPGDQSNTTTDLKILTAVTLEHPSNITTHFQHKPLLFTIEVAPKA